MKAVVLVGGEGTRLRPLTLTTPKPMLSLVNIPFMEHTFRMLKRYGISDIILATGYLPEVFKSYFGQGERLGINITYVVEEKPLGTCGAVKNVEQHLDDTFIVFNGDVLTGLNIGELVEYHQSKKALATITLTWVENPTAFGLVTFEESGKVAGFLEKPSWDQAVTNWVNAGTYVLEPEVLSYAPEGQDYSFERGLFPTLLTKGKPVYSFCSNDYWVDIGNPRNYLLAHHNILYGKVPFDFEGEEIEPGVWVGEDTKVEEGATLFGPTAIGKNCLIEKGATISSLNSIGDNCKISTGALIEESVILSDTIVGELNVVKQAVIGQDVYLGTRVRITDEAVIGDKTTVGDGNHLLKGIKVWPNTRIESRAIRF